MVPSAEDDSRYVGLVATESEEASRAPAEGEKETA